MKILFIVLFIIAILFCLVLFKKNTVRCTGGILKGCNKLLLPWVPKYYVGEKDHQKRYCCKDCLEKEVKLVIESDEYKTLVDMREIFYGRTENTNKSTK